MYRIYVRNKPLFLVDKITPEVNDYLHRPDTIVVDELNAATLKTLLAELEKNEVHAGVIHYPDPEAVLAGYKNFLTVVKAAGGLVATPNNEVLLIFRRGKWDLPKGKLDEGEELESCAVREIEEETGLLAARIVKPLHVTFHTYFEEEKHVLKESHWYLMQASKPDELTPQTEEDIEKCEWVPLADLPLYTTNMHRSIVDVICIGEAQLARKSN